MPARLITIPFSHFCEKARWALDRCAVPYEEDGHLPLFHYLANRRARAGRTVPVVIVADAGPEQILADSTDIIAWADAQRPGALLPADAAVRAEALALEDDLDRQLGPATRRWGYSQLLSRTDLDHVLTNGVPRWQASSLKLVRPIAIRVLKRSLNINPAGVARSRIKIDEAFARIDARLADGRRYLAGDRFTVADLTFAALAAPILMPPEHPYARVPLETFRGDGRAQIDAWRATPAGAFGLRIYRDERRAAA